MNLYEVSNKFKTKEDCIAYLEQLRWGEVPVCPYCGSDVSTPVKKECRNHCNNCDRSYSVLIGTIFEESRLPLPKFFMLIGLMLNAKKGISSSELSRELGITLKTAWYASMRVRCAMVETLKLKGTIEADEAYLSVKDPKKSKKKYASNDAVLNTVSDKPKRGRGTNKVGIEGFVERNGRVVTKVMDKFNTEEMLKLLHKYVSESGSKLITDDAPLYKPLGKHIPHKTIKHKDSFVKGDIHTGTIDSYWGLIKRGLYGHFHVLSKKYLPFYLAEFSYKYNRRHLNELQFEAFIEDALSEPRVMNQYKPVKKPTTIAYPKKDKEPKAHVRKFNAANKKAGKLKQLKKKTNVRGKSR